MDVSDWESMVAWLGDLELIGIYQEGDPLKSYYTNVQEIFYRLMN